MNDNSTLVAEDTVIFKITGLLVQNGSHRDTEHVRHTGTESIE